MKFIGMDIGDGESAVTLVSSQGVIMPQVLTMGAERNMVSVVGTIDGQPVVGRDALLKSNVQNRTARFKSRFLTDASAEEDIRNFARGLRKKLSETTSIFQDGDISIALGCPAGWTKEERSRYAAIITGAGFPNVYTVSESRAAFLFAHYSGDLGLSHEALSRPTLVVDIGSSTLDFAYIVDGKETGVGVFGDVMLGGGLLDHAILEDAIEASPQKSQIKPILDKYPSWRSYCELKARELKETYFSKEELWETESCHAYCPIYFDYNNPLNLEIKLDKAKMEKLLNQPMEQLQGKSFLTALTDGLQQARTFTAQHIPEQLILTGGASRMKFFQDACERIFSDANVDLCPEPEFSIARGLGIAARMDHELKHFREEIADYFKSSHLQTEIDLNLPGLLERLIPVMSDEIGEYICPSLLERLATRELSTPEALRRAMEDAIRAMFQTSDSTPKSIAILNSWVADKLKPVQEQIDQICDDYKVDKTDMGLTGAGIRFDPGQLPMNLVIRLAVFLSNVRVNFLIRPIFNRNTLRPGLTAELRRQMGTSQFSQAMAQTIHHQITTQLGKNAEKVEMRIN